MKKLKQQLIKAFGRKSVKDSFDELTLTIDSNSVVEICTQLRDEFMAFMQDQGISTSKVHERNDNHDAFSEAFVDTLYGVDQFCETQISIPVGWWLTQENLEHIANTVIAFSQKQ